MYFDGNGYVDFPSKNDKGNLLDPTFHVYMAVKAGGIGNGSGRLSGTLMAATLPDGNPIIKLVMSTGGALRLELQGNTGAKTIIRSLQHSPIQWDDGNWHNIKVRKLSDGQVSFRHCMGSEKSNLDVINSLIKRASTSMQVFIVIISH